MRCLETSAVDRALLRMRELRAWLKVYPLSEGSMDTAKWVMSEIKAAIDGKELRGTPLRKLPVPPKQHCKGDLS